MSKDKYRLYFSPRNIPLTVTQTVEHPTLCLELYTKWYDLFLLQPGSDIPHIVKPEHIIQVANTNFADIGIYTNWIDHCYHPILLKEIARRNGWNLCEQSYELAVGRWMDVYIQDEDEAKRYQLDQNKYWDFINELPETPIKVKFDQERSVRDTVDQWKAFIKSSGQVTSEQTQADEDSKSLGVNVTFKYGPDTPDSVKDICEKHSPKTIHGVTQSDTTTSDVIPSMFELPSDEVSDGFPTEELKQEYMDLVQNAFDQGPCLKIDMSKPETIDILKKHEQELKRRVKDICWDGAFKVDLTRALQQWYSLAMILSNHGVDGYIDPTLTPKAYVDLSFPNIPTEFTTEMKGTLLEIADKLTPFSDVERAVQKSSENNTTPVSKETAKNKLIAYLSAQSNVEKSFTLIEGPFGEPAYRYVLGDEVLEQLYFDWVCEYTDSGEIFPEIPATRKQRHAVFGSHGAMMCDMINQVARAVEIRIDRRRMSDTSGKIKMSSLYGHLGDPAFSDGLKKFTANNGVFIGKSNTFKSRLRVGDTIEIDGSERTITQIRPIESVNLDHKRCRDTYTVTMERDGDPMPVGFTKMKFDRTTNSDIKNSLLDRTDENDWYHMSFEFDTGIDDDTAVSTDSDYPFKVGDTLRINNTEVVIGAIRETPDAIIGDISVKPTGSVEHLSIEVPEKEDFAIGNGCNSGEPIGVFYVGRDKLKESGDVRTDGTPMYPNKMPESPGLEDILEHITADGEWGVSNEWFSAIMNEAQAWKDMCKVMKRHQKSGHRLRMEPVGEAIVGWYGACEKLYEVCAKVPSESAPREFSIAYDVIPHAEVRLRTMLQTGKKKSRRRVEYIVDYLLVHSIDLTYVLDA